MKFNKMLKVILISLCLNFLKEFGSVNAIENVNFNIVKTNFKNMKNLPFIYTNNKIDLNIKLCVSDSVKGFKINILFYRIDDKSICFHPMFKNCIDSDDNLKLIVKNSNNETVWETHFDEWYDYIDENGKLADVIETYSLLNIENGVYDVFLYDDKELLGSFKNVKFEKIAN